MWFVIAVMVGLMIAVMGLMIAVMDRFVICVMVRLNVFLEMGFKIIGIVIVMMRLMVDIFDWLMVNIFDWLMVNM